MNNDLEQIEEDLKKKDGPKKKVKVSGKSVFKLQKIIIDKSPKDGNERDSRETLAGDK